MSNDDNSDEDIRLRDKIAIAAMQALITTCGVWEEFIDNGEDGDDGHQEITEPAPRTERIALVAYRIADEMRKVRLKVFK
jgi:hypothetical protein